MIKARGRETALLFCVTVEELGEPETQKTCTRLRKRIYGSWFLVLVQVSAFTVFT